MKKRVLILKVALGICVAFLFFSLVLILEVDYSAFPNHVYTFLITVTVISGLGILILLIILAIVNPKENPIKIKTYRFETIDNAGARHSAIAVLEPVEQPNSKLRIDINSKSYSVISTDAFNALTRIREQTEKLGIKLLIQGTRPNCWPSGMSAQMSNGTKCYLHEMKPKKYENTDLVEIFDSANEDETGTLEEHNAFKEQWLNMLKESR
ncbi:MAG: hypothetical protein ACFB15_31880 [Cyclobacteriaceae bacterium]